MQHIMVSHEYIAWWLQCEFNSTQNKSELHGHNRHHNHCNSPAIAMQPTLQYPIQIQDQDNEQPGQMRCNATFDVDTSVMQCPHKQLYQSNIMTSAMHYRVCKPISLQEHPDSCITWPGGLPNSKSRSAFSGVHISHLSAVDSQKKQCSGPQKPPMSPEA